MRRPNFFLNADRGDCGCPPALFPYSFPMQQNAVPCLPPANGAVVSDDRYRTLMGYDHGKILVVPSGGNSQTFLTTPASTGTDDWFVVQRPDGQAYTTRTPTLHLPIINPAVSAAYPSAGVQFQFIHVQDAGGNWNVVASPTAGTFILESRNGSFVFVDAGSIPGIQEVGATGGVASKGMILILNESSPGVYVVQKLAVSDGFVLVGDVDIDGNGGYKALSGTAFLTHPKAKFPLLQSGTYQALDVSGTPITAGLPQAATTGAGAIADGMKVVYSPTNLRFYLAPADTAIFRNISTNTGAVTIPAAYASIPGSHGAAQTGFFNSANVQVSFFFGLGGTDPLLFNLSTALYRDGVLLQEFDNDNLRSGGWIYVDQNIPLGNHTYDVKWKYTSVVSSGDNIGAMRNSSFLVKSI